MSKMRQTRLNYIKLEDAVNAADLEPVERGMIEIGLGRVARRLPKSLKNSTTDAPALIEDTLDEAKEVAFGSLRAWRVKVNQESIFYCQLRNVQLSSEKEVPFLRTPDSRENWKFSWRRPANRTSALRS